MGLQNKNEGEEFEKKDVVKKYFAREFTVLTKEIRDRVIQLKLPSEERKKVTQELAFLPEEKQLDYLDELAAKIGKTKKKKK